MNNKNEFLIGLLSILLITCVVAQEQASKYQQVFLSKQKTFQLTGNPPSIGRYQLTIDKADIPKDQQKWYVFAMAEPKEKSKILFGSPYKIQIRKGDDLLKQCKIIQQSDACFIKNKHFDYTKDKLSFSVYCEQACQFQFVTQVDSAYPLKMNTPFKLDFEDSAYSKIFSLNTQGKDFYQLRIMLIPRGYVSYGEPVVLLANYGNQIPTQLDHDFKGIHTWEDGQGIFIRKSQLKENNLTILVQGPEKNVLDLVAQGWQKQQKLRIEQFLPQFDWIKAGQTRQAVLTINEKTFTHRVKIVVFSGGIQTPQILQMEQNSQKTYPLRFSMPSQKYGEFEFRLSKQLIQKQRLKKVVVRLTAKKDTTYLINYARQQTSISTIMPYVSQSSFMEPGQIDQYYLKVQQLMESTKQKKTSKIQLIFGNIQGNIDVTFYKCNSVYKVGGDNIKNCQVTQTNKRDFLEVQPVKYENRGSQKRFWFDIEWADHVKRSDRDKPQIIYQMAILVQNDNKDKISSYQVQYKNKDRIYLLREGQLTKDRIFINQKRHYKLSIQDSDASQVRIHCTRISGQAFFIGSFVDPRVNKDHEKILPLYSVLTFKINPQQKVSQVFLQVQGVDNAYYSLTTQIIRKSQANPKKNGTTGYNELIVRQGTPYQFIISPLQSIVLQIQASSNKINMEMKSQSAVKVCMTENLKSPPFAPNCEISNDFFLEMSEVLTFERGLIGNIGIKNTDTKKNVSVKIRISKYNNPRKPQTPQNISKPQTCQLAAMNQIMFQRLGREGKDTDGNTQHCLQFNINKNQQIQLIVDLKGQHLYNQGKITANINDQQNITILSPSHIFKKEEVESACSVKKQGINGFCYLKLNIEGITNTRVRVLVQYTNQAIRLIDGIAHPVHSTMIKNKPKHFYIGIHNLENITVVLQNKVGQYKIYASAMPYTEFTKKNSQSIFPTKQFKDIQSSNPFYYLQQILVVPGKNISEKCPQSSSKRFSGRNWVDCVLLISVYLDGSGDVQNNGKFVIQATQQNRQLKQGVPLNGYLQKKSLAFYHFQNQKQNGTILVSLNNQNKNCLDIYLRQGSQRATAQYNEKHAKATNSLIYNAEKVGTYSLTLEANENCPYTVTITTTKNKVARIKKGTFADINLAIDEQKYYLFENIVNQTFKILSLHKSGEVIISVNPVSRENLQKTLQSNLSDIRTWAWSNKDSVRVNNIDRKSGQDGKYCVNCYYLINIKAVRPTEASIVIPTPDSQLPITTDSMIKDMLLKQQNTTYRVFTESSAQFQVYVQYGRIQITILQSGKNTVNFNKTFQASKAPVLQTFNLTKTQQYDFLRYIKVVVNAQQDSYFSFSIVSNPDPTKRGPGIKYGLPQYIFVQANKQKCITGTMTVKIDQFLLSFTKSQRQTIQKMDMKIKVSDKQVTFDKQFGNNEMLARINAIGSESAENKKFQICFKSKTAVSITLIQSSPLNYWPQKQSILVKKQANLTFASEGKGVIELNQCQSRASAQMFSQFNDMKSTSSQIKQRRRSNNIVEFYHYGPVYIKVKSQKATVKWISINQTSGVGLGYQQYKSGSLRFAKLQKAIQIIAQPIKSVDDKQLSGAITFVKYQFYAASQQMQLYNAMNCGDGIYVKKVVQSTGSQKNKPLFKASFDIQSELKPKFGAQKYFLVGAKAIVSIKIENDIQQYRFFYPYQQLTKQILYSEQSFKPDVIQPEKQQTDQSKGGFLTLLGYILVAIILASAAYLIYSKCVKKCLSNKKLQSDNLGREMKYFDLSQQH